MNAIRFFDALKRFSLGAAIIGAMSWAAVPLQADEKNEPLIKQLLERLERVESELDRLKVKNAAARADERDQKVLTVLETPYLGTYKYGRAESVRFLAVRLIFVNLTSQPVTVTRDDISLNADEQLLSAGDVPSRLMYVQFQVGNQRFQMRNLKPADKVHLPVGGTGATWVLFTDLPRGNHIPKLKLMLKLAGADSEVDVNAFALGLLGLASKRIGPRESLGLLTISGAVNTVNVGSIIDALDRLSTSRVARVVIRWTDTAAPLDHETLGWFTEISNYAGRGEAFTHRFPSIPVSIRELHLASVPNYAGSGRSPGPSTGRPRSHRSEAEAVSAALRTAYEVLPRDELLLAIKQGDRLTRAAALAGGGGRLPIEQLPTILKHTDDVDVEIQRAALIALRHFGDPRAVDKLSQHVERNIEILSKVAIESLAASRYGSAHEKLIATLAQGGVESKRAIVGAMGRHPRPQWPAVVFEYANDPHSDVCADALAALVRLGHPKLIAAFEQALEQGSVELREKAFALLAARTDPRSEAVAKRYTLAHLESSPPTPLMNSLLERTKDPRAVPLLLKHVDSADNRSAIIRTLTQIGDQTVAQALADKYADLLNEEKIVVLAALQQMKSPAFRPRAAEALHSDDGALIDKACEGLQADGSIEAVQLLIGALEKSANTTTWTYTAKALGAIGTSEARDALRAARDSKNEKKQSLAINALRDLRKHSPGLTYVYQANNFLQNKKMKEALEQFSHAIKLDPELPEAYSGRANTFLQLEKHTAAKVDYKKALEIDPYDSQAVTGLGICMVIDGEYEQAIASVEKSRSKFKRDQIFAYNIACVYGRAITHIEKSENIKDRQKKIRTYEAQAIDDLKRSVKLGFRDLKWMNEDPDLNSLHSNDQFKKLIDPDGQSKEDADAEAKQEADRDEGA